MGLKTYRAKRTFTESPEPRGAKVLGTKHRFVIQKHDARALHYDFRLEAGGVLKSWAVPKGLPIDPGEKHLAVMVEDHPLEYRTFHGRIPEGHYGAGTVDIWDHGTYQTPGAKGPADLERHVRKHLAEGLLHVELHGKKLNGTYLLVRMAGQRVKNGWLIMRKPDEEVAATSTTAPGHVPHNIKPMLAQVANEPFDRRGWIFEPKWDGYRAIAEVEKGNVKLYSRNGQSFNKKMSELVSALQKLPADAVLDGEVVVFDAKGRQQFELLQEYFTHPTGTLRYQVFDLLYLNGHDLRRLPLVDRKKLLKRLVAGSKIISYTEDVREKGKSFFHRAVAKKQEGIMAKRADSTYQTGQRSADWLKIKSRPRQEAIIAGYTEPRGSRKYLGAVILAVYELGELRYIGHTGGGSSQTMLQDLSSRLKKLERKTSPFADPPKTNAPVHWVKPELVCEVAFQEWTKDGVMRQPILLGLRSDKSAKLVTKEVAMEGLTSHADKLYWPEDRITKGDLAEYYTSIAPYLLPHLKDRPLVMHRFPDGISGEDFFQKDNSHLPTWAKTITVHSGSKEKDVHYLVCKDLKTLQYVVQLGTIELNPWLSRRPHLSKPDYMVIDLDPEDIAFDEIVKTARVVKDVLDEVGARSYCKTSGARGLHVCVPLGAKYSYDQSVLFAQLIASIVHARLPNITSLERSPQKRQHKVYLDCFQNREGQTLIAPYSTRARPGAPVSTPLEWKEVKKGLDPKKFTLKNTATRLRRIGDLWKHVLGPGIDLAACVAKLKGSDSGKPTQ